MSGVRVLVGTKKGAFILESDGKRDKWEVSGPHFAGWEIYHVKGSPVDPDRIYASQTSGWFGQLFQTSTDGGKTWFQPGVPTGQDATPAFPNKAAAAKSWKGFRDDPEWKTAREASEKDGKLVEKVESVYMNATDYSPMK